MCVHDARHGRWLIEESARAARGTNPGAFLGCRSVRKELPQHRDHRHADDPA
jgi:hypothetical protein